MITRTYNPIDPGKPAIWLYGRIGENVLPQTVLGDLRRYPEGDDPIDIMIESDGGYHAAGMDIYAVLRDHPRPKRVTVLVAKSIAVALAMTGETIRIIEKGSFFLHPAHVNPQSMLRVSQDRDLTARELRSWASSCDAADLVYDEIILRRTRADRAFLESLKGLETTLDAARAVELGFADEIVTPWCAT